MNIKLICVGKLSEKFFKEAVDEYKKRIGGFSKIEILEIAEEKTSNQNPSDAEIGIILKKEGNRILEKISDSDFVITLEILGKMMDSESFASLLDDKMKNGISRFVFVIGGSYGMSDEVKSRSNYKLSFSKFTFAHQLFRVVLL